MELINSSLVELLDFLKGMSNSFHFFPHGYHGLGEMSSFEWSFAVFNFLAGLAYLCIPIVMICILLKRKEGAWRWVLLFLAAFVFCEGLWLFSHAVRFWHFHPYVMIGIAISRAIVAWGALIYLMIIFPTMMDMATQGSSEKLGVSILNHLPTAVLLLNDTLHVTDVNKAAALHFMLKEAELKGRCIYDLFDQDCHDRLRTLLEELPAHQDILLYTTDPQKRRVWVNVQAIPDKQKDRFLLSFKEMTTLIPIHQDHLQHQEELETVLAYKNAIFHNMQDGVITLTSTGIIETMNPKAEEILGYRFEELKGAFINKILTQMLRVTPSEGIEILEDNRRRTRRGPQEAPLELYINLADGKSKVLEIRVSSMNIHGEEGYCLILHDITERKNYEDQLRSNQELLTQIAENIEAVVWIISAETKQVLYCSPSVRRVFGIPAHRRYQENQLIWLEYIHPEDREEVQHSFYSEGLQGPWRRVFRALLPSGEVRYVSASSFIVRADGAPYRVAGIIVDVTELYHAKQALEAQKDELARKCQELNLRNEELDTFAHIIAHDLKAPLFAINNLANWIQEDCGHLLTPEAQQYLTLLLKRAHRMETLLDDIFSYFFKTDASEVQETINWKNLLEEILQTISLPVGFQIIDETGLDSLYTNKILLRQVISNLLTNAIKHHHHPAQGRVSLKCQRQGDVYIFDVTDNGPGIPAQYLEEIFKPLKKMKSRDDVEGSGMGLAIVKKIVQQMGGHVTVTSEIGKGSTFSFTWPLSHERLAA